MKRMMAFLMAVGLLPAMASAAPTISDLKVTPVEPLGLAIDYSISGATKYDEVRPIEVRMECGDYKYTAKNLVGETNCVNGAHRVYWNMAEDGLTVNLCSNEVTVTYKYVASDGAQYCVIDLAGGANTNCYPVTYLDEDPGTGNEYKTTKLVLKRVESGSFVMGEDQEDETHQVTLTKPFYLGLFEVTQKQWSLVMGSDPCSSTSSGKGDAYPVHYVSYNKIRGKTEGAKWPATNSVDETSFLGKLRAKTGLDFDLPTEAQWEYACRAGTTTKYSFGDKADDKYMWFYNNSSNSTHEVGTKEPNDWGFYDMHGNVWEWCRDWYAAELLEGEDPEGPATGSSRVRRGGGYSNLAINNTSFYRIGADASGGDALRGFRLSRTFSFEAAPADDTDDASATAVFWNCRTVAAGSKINGTQTLGAAPTTTSSATMKVDDGVVIHTTTAATSTWQARTKGDHTVTHTEGGVSLAATYSVTNIVFWQQAAPVPPMAVDETIMISPTSKVFATSAASGATIQTSTTSSNGTWTAEVSDSWITLSSERKRGSAGERVVYSVAENVGAETRVGYVYVAGHVYTVTQPGRGVTAKLDRETLSVDVAGGSASVTVTPSDATTTWHARSEADWLSVSPTEAEGSGVVTVTAAPWCELTSRTGTVVVVGRRMTVVQTGGSFVANVEVSASGDTSTLAVVATNGLAWTATSDADWLTVSPTTGVGGGVVRWTAAPQTTFEGRSATIKVTADVETNLVLQTTTVTQQAARVWFEGETTRRYDAGGAFNETVTVRVDVASMLWTVNVSTNAANKWINLVGSSSQKGDDVEIRFMVYDASEAELPRTATISVGNAVLRIIQGDALLIEDGDTEFFIPTTWLAKYYPDASESEWQTIVEGAGLKTDASGAAVPVWQDYVAGTDPTNALSKFTTKIELTDGKPVVTWTPALNGEGVREGVRTYRVWGKANLTDAAWSEVSSGDEASYRFFRVTVEMP